VRCSSTSARTTAPRQRGVISGFLHITNGTSVTGTFPAAGVTGDFAWWGDVLHDGPVPGNVADDELVAIRARFLCGGDAVRTAQIGEGFAALRSQVDRSFEYDEVVLWYEHDLFDQLNLIDLLDRIGRVRPRPRVSMICVGAFPGRPTFHGLGELTPSELGSLLPTRTAVTEQQYATATRAWQAFRSTDPRAIERVLAEDLSALPFLGRALARHLEQFPGVADGLSRTERRLLHLAADEAIAVHRAFVHVSEDEDAFYIGDTSFWDAITELASTTPALLDVSVPLTPMTDRLPDATIALTAAGRDVLRGAADRVQLCGIDRWFGGVHLAGHGPVWRWDAEQKRMREL
jgi:hypothetical protein